MPRKKAAAKSEAEETTEVLDTKEPERPMSPNEGPAEIGYAGGRASHRRNTGRNFTGEW